MSEIEYTFTITTPLEVEESVGETVVLTGTFLRLNKATNNGREYLIEEGEEIANGLIDMPVGFGADWLNRHIKDPANHIGKVLRAWFDKATNTIKGKVQIWNTSKFPSIIEKVKSGWGFSIGGTAQNLIPNGALNKLGKAIMRVIGMKPNHLQLLEPKVKRGQEEARVDGLELVEETYWEVEETLSFEPCPWGICEIPEEYNMEESEGIILKKAEWEDVKNKLSELEKMVKSVPEEEANKIAKSVLNPDTPEQEDAKLTYVDGAMYIYSDGEFTLKEEPTLLVEEEAVIVDENPVTETDKYKKSTTYIIPGKGVKKIRHG